MTAPATAQELHALLDLARRECSPAVVAWLRARLPPLLTPEQLAAHTFAQALAPSLQWGEPGHEVYAELPVPVRWDAEGGRWNAGLLVSGSAWGRAHVTFLCGGLRWEATGPLDDPGIVARPLHRRAQHYLRRWAMPADPGRRDFMFHRRDSAQALVEALAWAVD